MASRWSVLARLFRRTDNEVISALYTHALNRPLFVEPAIGESLLGAYMAGAIEYEIDRGTKRRSKIGLLDISGALASRPMPGLSGPGPQSYEEIRADFDAAMDDESIEALVLRMDTPGGFAAGLFDLTDHIYSRRGEKPIHAVVDDIAYSAGYGIAAAADEIWVTRTGGVGSVGVVAYHVDQSERDKQQGFKVTALHAGARKIDWSPHFPLSEEAMQREQAEIDRLYDLFAGSVAKYRGLEVEAVKATEAALYHGPAALEVGFADRIGTLQDALAHLAAGETTTTTEDPEMSSDNDQAREAQRVQGVITAAVLATSLAPAVQTALLKAGLKEDELEARIAHAKSVQELCTTAKADARAASFVAANTPLEVVRQQLVDAAAAAAPEVDVTLPNRRGGPNGPHKTASAAEIYESRRKDVEASRR